jgi:hypothetical protein
MEYDDVEMDLLMMASEWGVRVGIPIECEQFFQAQVKAFTGTRGDFLAYVKRHLPYWFRSVNELPQWIHEAEWQFFDGRPMLFVGQHDVSQDQSGLHDDASLFVFWDPRTGETKTVIQIA